MAHHDPGRHDDPHPHPGHHHHDRDDGGTDAGDPYGRAYFDASAETWDDPAKIERAEAVADAIASAVPLRPTTRLLEYGAGTGLVSEALRPRVGPVTLAEPSEGMRAVIRSKIERGALAGARVWDLDLETDDPPAEQFDLVVTVMVLHHVADLDRVLTGFAALLAPGGHLCVVDLDHEDGSFHGEGFAGHHGFRRPELAARLASARFTGIEISDCWELVRDGVAYPLFLALARRPPVRT